MKLQKYAREANVGEFELIHEGALTVKLTSKTILGVRVSRANSVLHWLRVRQRLLHDNIQAQQR